MIEKDKLNMKKEQQVDDFFQELEMDSVFFAGRKKGQIAVFRGSAAVEIHVETVLNLLPALIKDLNYENYPKIFSLLEEIRDLVNLGLKETIDLNKYN